MKQIWMGTKNNACNNYTKSARTLTTRRVLVRQLHDGCSYADRTSPLATVELPATPPDREV